MTRSRKILQSNSLIRAKRRQKSRSNNVDHDLSSRVKANESESKDNEQDDGPKTTKRFCYRHVPEDPLTRERETNTKY